MNHLVVTDQSIAETVHQIRHSRHQLAQMSRLLCAIELDIQYGQMRNLPVLSQRAQQLCEQLSKDFIPQLDWLEAHLEALGRTDGEPNHPPGDSLDPSATFPDHIGWLVALTKALRSDVKPG